MKKYGWLILFIILLGAIVFAVPTQAASSGTCGENLTWTLDDAGNLTIGGTGEMTDYGFNNSAPWGTSVTSVTIGNGVTSIGSEAFYGCSSLITLNIPSSITTIESAAFLSCVSLENVYISELTSYLNINFAGYQACPMYWGEKLYLNEKRLVNAVIPDGITQIPAYAFNGCDSLVSVTIPDSVTSIGEGAFGSCDGLESVYITDLASYLSIAFADDQAACPMYYAEKLYVNDTLLIDAVIPNGVTQIPMYAFYNCGSLKSVTIPDSVTGIGTYAFYRCDSLKNATIPGGVTTISEYAFYSCDGLISVTIENGVTGIEENTFSYCFKLQTVVLPRTITEIEVNAFSGCNSITAVKYEGTDAEWAEIYIGSGNDALKNANITYGHVLPLTVFYDANGGQNAPAAQKTEKNTAFTVSTAVPTRTDCKFLGWALEKDAEAATVRPGGTVAVGEENITLYAVWQNIVSTSTVIARNTIMVTPKNAEPGNTILVVCYKGSEMVYWELYPYAGEAIVPFTPSVSYDTVRVAVWNGWLTPLSKAETKS